MLIRQPNKRGSSRRTFLRGAFGATIALPLLASLWPSTGRAQATNAPGLFSICLALGTAKSGWWPETGAGPLTAASFPTGHTFAELSHLRDRMLFVKGLDNVPHDEGCDHLRTAASLLSAQPHRTDDSAGNRAGTDSIDTVIARAGQAGSTPLVLFGGKRGAALYETSTHSAGDPITGIRKPAQAFNTIASLFEPSESLSSGQARRIARGKSILDYVHSDLCDLRDKKLSASDRQKLEAYTEGLRSVEKDLDKAGQCNLVHDDYSDYDYDPASPSDVGEYAKMLIDIGVLAMACGYRKAVTMYMGGEAAATDWSFIGVTCNDHHGLSHWTCAVGAPDAPLISGADEDMHRIDVWQAQHLFGRAIEGLQQLQGEGDDMLSENSVLLVNGFSDGRKHLHRDMPFIIAGSMGGYFKEGQLIEVSGGATSTDLCAMDSCQPHNNMLAMLGRAAGANIDHFGHSSLPTVEHTELRP